MSQPAFRALTVKYNQLTNRIITEVKISIAFDNNSPPTPLPPTYTTTALWDTGASKSCVTQDTIVALGLVPVGIANVTHFGGTSQSNTYVVNFYLPNSVAVKGVLVSKLDDPTINSKHDFGAVIGMDIITLGDMAITNVNGETWMSFRVPTVRSIDYVSEANQLVLARVGRNDPCPCGKKDARGNRVKFKYCHEPMLR